MGCPTECVLGDNIVFSICTHDPDTGVLTDANPVPAYRIYEDETGAAILNDNMAKLDDGNTTGFYTELIAATTGNGFEAGKTYTIYIEATVDSDKGGITFAFKVTDLAEVVEGTLTVKESLRLMLSFIAAKVSGGGTATIAFRDVGDTKDRITMTVDAAGDRSAVVRDGS